MKITNVNDYVDIVHDLFPELSESDIKRILVYGFKQIILYVSAGNDVSVMSNKGFYFFGKIPVSALAAFNTYCRKLAKRILYMFKRTKSEWDGYYYFALTENQYKNYLSQNRKKYKIFKDVFLYKILEHLKIKEHNKKYIFRLSEDKTNWTSKYYPELRTKNAELILIRDPLNMRDIMTSYNKFKYLQL